MLGAPRLVEKAAESNWSFCCAGIFSTQPAGQSASQARSQAKGSPALVGVGRRSWAREEFSHGPTHSSSSSSFLFFFLNQETTQTQHPIWFITRGKKRLEKNIQLSQRSVKTQVPMPWSERQQQTSTSSKSSANGAFLKQMQYQTGFCHLGWHLHAFGSHPA